jgi:hypothetical protein
MLCGDDNREAIVAGVDLEGDSPLATLQALDEDDSGFVRAQLDGALARRGAGFLRARRALWIQWLWAGCLGIGGMLVLGWSGQQAALLMLATFWLGWIEDVVVWRLRSPGLATSLQHAADDMRFWQFVAILRKRRKHAPDTAGHPPLALGLIVDLVAGTSASVLILSGLERSGGDVAHALGEPGLALAIAASVVAGVIPSLRARLSRSGDGSTPLPLFAVGQRGIGMLVLAFGLMAFGGGGLAPALLVGCAYGFSMLMAVIELIWGIPALSAEARWAESLRDEIR